MINLGFVLFFVLYELQAGADRLAKETVGGEDGSSIGKRNNSQQMSHGSVPKHSEYKSKFGSKNRQEWHSHGGIQEVPIKLQEGLDPLYIYICMYVFTYVVFSIALY